MMIESLMRKYFNKKLYKGKKGINKSTAPDIKTYNQLVNFAFNYPVNSLKYADEHLWPYIRHHLLVQLTALSIGNSKGAEINPFRLQLGNPEEFDYDRKVELAKKYGIRFLDEMKSEKPIDFLFFTALNASEQIDIESKIYYRVTDPLFELAKEIGSARKVELIRNNSPALYKIPRYSHKPTFIFAPHIIRSGYSQNVYIKESIESHFQKYLPNIKFDRSKLNRLIDWELHTRDFCLEMLRCLKPKVIFVPSFHYYAPLISAARELGILSVDIQHGIQVGYSPLYNNWNEMPPEGYKCLPDRFLVWTEKEQKNISKVFRRHSSANIIGNLWLQKQLKMDVKFSSEFENKLSKYKRIILLAMQSQTEVPQLFKDIINGSGDEYLWIIRMHPKGKKYKSTDFAIKTDNIMINDEVDRIPIVSLLSRVDITISEGSTIAAEGNEIGVTAFITSETGRLNYKQEIEQGVFYYIKDLDSFLKSAEASGDRKRGQVGVLAERDVASILVEMAATARPNYG